MADAERPTGWSLVIDVASEGDEQAASGLAALCEIYWLILKERLPDGIYRKY
jgi:hypothetical protein